MSISPDGRRILLTLWSGPAEKGLQYLGAEDYEPQSSVGARNHWGVTFHPSNGTVMIGGRFGNLLVRSDDLTALAGVGVRSRSVVTDRSGTAWWAVGVCFACPQGFGTGAYKLRQDGAVERMFPFPTQDTRAFALSLDDQLFVVAAFPLVYVLRASDLSLVRSFDFSTAAGLFPAMVIPLERPGQALLIGYSSGHPAAITILPIDYDRGVLGTPVSLPAAPGQELSFGYGNPWTRIDDWIVVVTGYTTLVLDGVSGDVVARQDDLPSQADVPVDCCEVTYDSVRRRLIVVGQYAFPLDGFRGRMISYQVRRAAR